MTLLGCSNFLRRLKCGNAATWENFRLHNFFQRDNGNMVRFLNGYLQPQNLVIWTWNNWLYILVREERKDKQFGVE